MQTDEDTESQAESPKSECLISPNTIDNVPAKPSVMAKKRQSLRGNIRYVMAAHELSERENEVEGRDKRFSSRSEADQNARDGGSPGVSIRLGSFETLKEGPKEAEFTMENPEMLKFEDNADVNDNYDDGLIERKLDAGDVREIAVRALAISPEKCHEDRYPSTPPQQVQRIETTSVPEPSSLSLMYPPYDQARSPLRSPCWRTLVPVTPPPGGYWTPSATENGQKNTPMCPPCRSGKKGRCFGGLPCERCKDKNYTKERCEGSLVFHFSPKKKVVAVSRDQTGAHPDCKDGSLVKRGRGKRDAFGRFA